jgi:hypothetical protein
MQLSYGHGPKVPKVLAFHVTIGICSEVSHLSPLLTDAVGSLPVSLPDRGHPHGPQSLRDTTSAGWCGASPALLSAADRRVEEIPTPLPHA